MHLIPFLSITLSTLAAASPLPLSTDNTLEARAPTSPTPVGKLIEPLNPKSVHDADDKENTPTIILPKRDFWDNVGDDLGDSTKDALNDLACYYSALADDPCQKKKTRSIHEDDASYIDDEEEEKPAVGLRKRGFV